jgi:subtilisin family serine protease
MKTTKLIAALAGTAALVSLAVLDGAAKASAPGGKIARRVLSDTAGGKRTEALVVLRAQANLAPAEALATKADKGRFVVDALRAVANATQGPLRAELAQRGVPHQSFYIVNMIKVEGDRALMQDLAARPDVDRIDANPRVRGELPVPSQLDAGAPDAIEWNVARVRAPDVWALGFHGEGRVVADADTGVDWDHPSLKAHYRGWDGNAADHDFNWHDAIAGSPVPIDPHAHGTFTTSQMVGDDGAGNQVGVAPGAEWIGCRNMDASGTGTPASYTECFEWLIAPYPIGGDPSQGDPSLAPDSINNSWGCPPSEGCNKGTLSAIVKAVRAAGIFPAVSAGNSGPSCFSVSDPPAIYKQSYTVGATTMSDTIAGFSSRGPVGTEGDNRWIKPNISAPGQSIRGAVPGTGYQTGWSGTSMAAPHIAGGIALLWQAKPTLIGNVTASEQAFNSTAVPKTSTQNCGGSGSRVPNAVYGWGLVDLFAAVDQ